MIIFFFIAPYKIVLAQDEYYKITKKEYTEEYKNWLNLSDEEKKDFIIPRMYDTTFSPRTINNPLRFAKTVKLNSSNSFHLKSYLPNLIVRNQYNSNSCWAFAALSSLETNLALSDYYNGISNIPDYDFSERHLEYATSQSFTNGPNPMGYSREVNSGGNFTIASSYLTNGSGAVKESDMKFENFKNNPEDNKIDISKIDKTVVTQVHDTVFFPDYNSTNINSQEIMNRIKFHIQNYGSVYSIVHTSSDSECYKSDNFSLYCNTDDTHIANHGVAIVGWDDNYLKENFFSTPSDDGAWIVKNSWGENYDDNGYIYVSYYDNNISQSLAGIVSSSNFINYDTLYQYDEFFPTFEAAVESSNFLIASIFDKNSNNSEYLTQVALTTFSQYNCEVYVDPNFNSQSSELPIPGSSTSNLKKVKLKSGDSETDSKTIEPGYHTLEFKTPVEITGNSFAVIIKVSTNTNTSSILLETNHNDPTESKIWSNVKSTKDKCFISTNCQEWINLYYLQDTNNTSFNADNTIKAFTTNKLYDESLERIEITNEPTKKTYFEGDNFDKTGMEVTAYYNSIKKPSEILNDNSYTITNGSNLKFGQTSVSITFDNKTVEQPITVKKNNVLSLSIETAPTKTNYKEGEHFDTSGMIVKATMENGTEKTIDNYTIDNGYNIKVDQRSVSISYGGKTVSQNITVNSYDLQRIAITTPPTKTNYVAGQDFDKTGMIVTGYFKNDSNDEFENEIIEFNIENGTDLKTSQTSITVEYLTKTASQNINVVEKSITEISVKNTPSKTIYIQNKEQLDLSGGKLQITYNDNSTEILDMTSTAITSSGFDNSTIGEKTILLQYNNFTTQFNITIVEPEAPKHSNFSNAQCNLNAASIYGFTDSSKRLYMTLDITLTNISRALFNDSVEYYYSLSSISEPNIINNWTQITDFTNSSDNLSFILNTNDMEISDNEYNDIFNSDSLYLFIKEVSKKGDIESVYISPSFELIANSETTKTEIFVDNINLEDVNFFAEDTTTSDKILPQTGVKTILSFVLISIFISLFLYYKYNSFSKWN